MKRFISILVAVMMVLTLLPLGRVFAEEEEVTKQEEKVMEVPGEGEKAPGEGEKAPGEGEKAPGDDEGTPGKDEETEQIDVEYKYVSDSAENVLPASIVAPKSIKVDKGETVDVPTKPEDVTTEEGTWTFVSWDPNEAQADVQKNLTFTGTWKFTKKEEPIKEQVDVEYKYVSDSVENVLPASIVAPKSIKVDKGETVDVPTKPEDVTTEEGTWTFVSWDPNEAQADVQKNLTFTGTWKFTKKENSDPEETPEEKIAKAKKALKAKIDAATAVKDTDKYKNATKTNKDAFDNALEAAESEYKNDKATVETLDAAGTLLDSKKNALDGKTTTPSVPSDNYSTRVPRAIRNTIANANAMMTHPRYGFASYSSRANLENRLSSLKSIANDFENGYYNKYWNGKFWNGYYGDEWYDYYENGYYYRNGVPYTYSGFRAHFGYYPKYDMSDYYGRGYWNGKYRRGYYRDGWYDYYENGYYYRDGVPYTYSEFRREFGYYPSYAYGRGYWYDYDEDCDPYYGYQGRYGYYYGSSIRDAVERTVDAINAVAISADAPLMKVSYPSSSDYDGYYDYYPWYYDPYYYDGYYYDQNSSKIRELKKLIGEAEELAASRSDAQWAPYRSELTDAANYGRKAAKGRASVTGAIEELEKAIKKAKTDGMKLYIRRGYMTGVNGTEFNPSGTLTRAEMAQIIENLLEQSGDTVAFAPKNFNDVEAGRWYKKAVNLVSSHNIMKGNPDGNFYPQKPVSIEELIVIAARLGGHTPQNGNVFGIEKHYWSVHYIQTAYVKGWIGMDKFNPSAPITRGQAVQILNRSLNFGVDKEFINKYGAQMNKFSDVTMSSPYYYDIVAATNTISYSQVPKSRTRIWRAYQTSNGWSSSKYSNGTYVKPYTGW